MCHIVELTEVAAISVMVVCCVGIAAIVRMMLTNPIIIRGKVQSATPNRVRGFLRIPPATASVRLIFLNNWSHESEQKLEICRRVSNGVVDGSGARV
jgi:hypothetical protein